MLTQFRSAALAAAVLGAVYAGQAFAQWPASEVVRIEPGYGGVCEECDLSGRILAGARMTNSVFNGTNFSNAVLTRADASRSEFDNADFSQADLRNTKLVEAQCEDAQFNGARLAQADATGANFTRADFSDADVTQMRFHGANLAGANLRTAIGLTQAQLNTACADRRTRLPRGLRARRCG